MPELRRLQPHDPLPESGCYLLVIRRFAEEAPGTTLVELITADGHIAPELTILARPDGSALDFEGAVAAAVEQAGRTGVGVVYVVDRTAGPRERQVLASGGDHTVGMAALDDMDLEEGERGSDMRDRPPELGGRRS